MARFKERFTLFGGAALIARFGHRTTQDLNFFTADALDALRLAEVLQSDFEAKIDLIDVDTVNATLPDGTHLSFFGRMRLAANNEERIFQDGGFAFATPLEIGVAKLAAIMGRVKVEDYRDLAEIERRGPGIAACFAASDRLWGRDFPKAVALRALSYLADPGLVDLSPQDRTCLQEAVRRIAKSLGESET